ncbi:MAG TPA: hemolysin III family protein [Rectinemataceae bacterium]|nr:hemolysin III family protein [Rectinemataceae bacterium]
MTAQCIEASSERRFTLGEEIANAVTHGIGALLSVLSLVLLVHAAMGTGDRTAVAASAVFGLSLVLLFSMSTVYHALGPGAGKRVFEILDHASIYVLIAGTYTAFCLGPLRYAGGGRLLALVWTIAVAGIVFKSLCVARFRIASTVAYVLMGWLLLPYLGALRIHLNPAAFDLLFLGGIFYTAGVAFYALKRLPWFHPVWHLFVLAGAACHVAAILVTLASA